MTPWDFLTETGAQGVFQESLTPQNTAADFPETVIEEILKAYFPQDIRSEKRIVAVQKYIDSLSEIFPDFEKSSFTTEIICDRTGANNGKNILSPYG